MNQAPKVHAWIPGIPIPQGSLKHVGRGRLVHSNDKKLKQWRDQIANSLRDATDVTAYTGQVFVYTAIYVPIPKTVTRRRPTSRRTGDLDKHVRAVLDAITQSGLIVDDSQVTRLTATKDYNDITGAHVSITLAADE